MSLRASTRYQGFGVDLAPTAAGTGESKHVFDCWQRDGYDHDGLHSRAGDSVDQSQIPTHVNFAAMECTTLPAAHVADLAFLPALLWLFPETLLRDSSVETLDVDCNVV
ncbi:MAG: hypothetical protein P8J37_11710 [Fuerstiella sp.]|nr:hypothetical protein [Fuerstiella sp.]